DSSGNLVATKIEIKPDNSLRLLGNIESITAPGTVVVNGVTVQLSGGTRMDDKSQSNVQNLQFSDLHTNEYVEIRGWAGSAPNTIAAMILERNDVPSNVNNLRFEIQGVASNQSDPTLVILGVTIDTTGASFTGTTRTGFFVPGTNGRLVKVRGNITPIPSQPFRANQQVEFQSP
ncbi:MAG: DUF5666 domain-containing protein, partial [Steroidobacteraceae bacterium]